MNITFRKNQEIFPFVYSRIDKTVRSLKIAMAWFTDPELLKLILGKKNGMSIAVQVIIYDHEINSMLTDLRLLQESLSYSNLNNNSIMHHKFVLVDDEVVITGSYNWTIKARRYNRENILEVRDPVIVQEYSKEFENLLKNSKPMSQIAAIKKLKLTAEVEDEELLRLEQLFNQEIYQKIKEAEKLHIGVSIPLAYELVEKHTPVIAAARLASAENGELIQSGLQKLQEAGRLDLSFEESITDPRYARLFKREVIEFAKRKLDRLT